MKTRKGFEFRIYPDDEQRSKLAIQFGHTRFVYNRYRHMREMFYSETGDNFSYVDCANDMSVLKKTDDFAWLKEADSQALQQSLKDLDKAYVNFFEGRAEYPKFKSKHNKQSFRYPQRFKIERKRIYLPKVGWVHIHNHRPLEGTPKNCTVSKTKSGKYFVSIQCEIEIDVPEQRPGEVGIDLGLKDFATLSTGEKIEPPKHYRKAERRLKIRQRRLSRKVKGSNNRNKQRVRVAKQHEKVANQRKDFHHKTSRDLVNRFGFIAFEDLNVKGMMANHHLAKSIGDAGWSQFVAFTEYKAKWASGTTAHVDRFFPSSKLCSCCGAKNTELKLRDRQWQCTNCQTIHDRDKNASTNILAEAIRTTTAGTVESHAQQIRPAVTQSGWEKSRQNEAIQLSLFEAQAF